MVRKKKGKKEKSQIIIFVEGETEEQYFNILRQKLRLTNVKTKIMLLNNSGSDWIDKAKKIMKNSSKIKRDKNTSVFVVFDKDDIKKDKFDLILKKSVKEDMILGFSNNTFEVWLLSHYEKLTKGQISTKDLIRKLEKHLGNSYKKADTTQLTRIVDNYQSAIINSRDISEINYYNQCTNIGDIVSNIIQN